VKTIQKEKVTSFNAQIIFKNISLYLRMFLCQGCLLSFEEAAAPHKENR